MDHMMPGMDGIDATKSIRAFGASLPIIALSANAVMGIKDMFVDAGMNDFLAKPIVVKELHQILLEYLPPEKIII